MAKNKVSEWSTTASNNTDIGGINIAEGCAPSGINNAIRELMAQVKDMQTGADADGLVVGGAFTCSGAAVFSSTVALGSTATATTQSAGDNSTKVATTAYVDGLGRFADPGANGVVVRTATNTSTARTITAGTGITVTNGTGVSGNPTIGITDGSITATQLASSAVQNAKINNGAVSAAKLDGAQSGSAPIYGVRAWVNFDGTTGSINSSGNVSSVTKNTTGDWTINFSTALPTANYALSGSARPNANNTQGVAIVIKFGTTPSTSSVTIRAINDDASSANPSIISVIVIC